MPSLQRAEAPGPRIARHPSGASRLPVVTGLVLLLFGTANSASGQGTTRGYRIELPPAASAEEAGALSARLEGALQGSQPIYVDLNRPTYHVRVGDFRQRADAREVMRFLQARGFTRLQIVSATIRPQPGSLAQGYHPPGGVDTAGAAPSVASAAPGGEGAPAAGSGNGDVRTVGAAGVSAPPAADFQGFHGNTTCEATYGWVWNRARPDDPVSVDLYDGDRLVATVVADRFRRDLEESGKGSGRYGFVYEFPDSAGAPPAIEARISGTDVRLRGTPRANPCKLPDGLPAEVRAASVADAPVAAGPPPRAPSGPKTVTARPVPVGSVVLDGRLDDEVWRTADFITDFQQKGLDRGFPRPEWTRVAIVFDDEALYVGARLEGADPGLLDTRINRRDQPGNVDRLLVSLDTYGDRRTAYTFGVTAGGVRLDHHHPTDREFPKDDSWDPVWDARTTVDSTGWSAEMRIPISQLRFNDGGLSRWGLNIRRWNPQELMNLYWVVVPLAEQGWASRFGDLMGLDGLAVPRRVEIAPYVLGSMTLPDVGPAEGDGPTRTVSRFGGDLKLGVGPDLTLDATFNPDFGQVEADPAEVNLTAFETSFEERRPFFIEGNQLLTGDGPRYFYSRRVGSIPHGTDPGDAVDMPVNSTILGALKLTGRTGSGLSVGGLAAVTAGEVATIVDEGTGARDTQAVSPSTGYAVGRLQQEVGRAGSTLGITLTGVQRAIEPGSVLETVLTDRAFAGGADWSLRLAGGDYRIDGHAGFSVIRGHEAAIARAQRSSAHYFQRPDAEHVSFDPTRTSLSGYAGGLTMAKVAGTHWTWEAGVTAETPGFDIRDAGIMRSADDVLAFGSLDYKQVKPGPLFRNYRLSLLGSAAWNFGGVPQFLSPGLVANLTWPNFWRSFVLASYEAPVLSDELTRGGPLMRTAPAWNASAGLSSSFAARTQWSLDGSLRQDGFGGWSYGVNTGVAVRAGSHVGFSLHPGWSRSVDPRQFYGTLPGGPDATFGTRYIFSRLERSELYARARVDLALTPDLTVEIHAEPFASSGDYLDFGELVEASGDSVRVYAEDGATIEPGDYGSLLVRDRNGTFTLWPTPFNVRSFRSSAVVRWEWQRGSTVHLIWQQNRWGYEEHGTLVEPRALVDALRDSGENILTVKVTWRMGVR